jgi:hypothetical protein
VAAQGDVVVVWDGTALHRLSGGTFETAWETAADGPRGFLSMIPVSDHEVWVTEQRDGSWLLWRWFDGRWTIEGGPWDYEQHRGFWPQGAAASDGAAWVVTPEGTTRFGAKQRLVDDATSEIWMAMAPGRDGQMAVMVSGTRTGMTSAPELGPVLLADPTGATTDLGVPPLPVGSFELAVADDGVWVAVTYPEPALARWDGGWQPVDLPEGALQLTAIAAAGDGAVWLGYLDDQGAYLARWSGSGWTTFPTSTFPGRPLVVPGGSVMCASSGLSTACFDEAGPAAEPAALSVVPDFSNEVRVAPDGSIWVYSEDVVRVGRV